MTTARHQAEQVAAAAIHEARHEGDGETTIQVGTETIKVDEFDTTVLLGAKILEAQQRQGRA